MEKKMAENLTGIQFQTKEIGDVKNSVLKKWRIVQRSTNYLLNLVRNPTIETATGRKWRVTLKSSPKCIKVAQKALHIFSLLDALFRFRLNSSVHWEC